jgi:hypothetical protein
MLLDKEKVDGVAQLSSEQTQLKCNFSHFAWELYADLTNHTPCTALPSLLLQKHLLTMTLQFSKEISSSRSTHLFVKQGCVWMLLEMQFLFSHQNYKPRLIPIPLVLPLPCKVFLESTLLFSFPFPLPFLLSLSLLFFLPSFLYFPSYNILKWLKVTKKSINVNHTCY